jgi:hypothetical protein
MEGSKEFRPELLSHKDERNAWILTAVGIASYFLIWGFAEPSKLHLVIVIFLLVSALFISLTNWMDRKTRLILGSEGIKFQNGLRNVALNWGDVNKVSVVRDRWGERVHVYGNRTYFSFRKLGDVKMQGKVRGQIGFPEGQEILQQILKSSGLVLMEEDDRGHYYARAEERVAQP